MSDEIMLQGVLRMPIDCWSDDPINLVQRHGRYIQAADRIESLEKRVKELNNDLEDRQKGFEDILRCYDMPNKVISTCKKFVG